MQIRKKAKLLNKVLFRLYKDTNICSEARNLYLILFLYAENKEFLNLEDIYKYCGIENFGQLKQYLEQLKDFLRIKFNGKEIVLYKFNLLERIIKVQPKLKNVKSVEEINIKKDAVKIVKGFYQRIHGFSPNFSKDVGIIANLIKKLSKEEVVNILKWCLINKRDKMYNLNLFPSLVNEARAKLRKEKKYMVKERRIPIEQLKEYIVERDAGLYKPIADYEKMIKYYGIVLEKSEREKIKDKLGID